MAKEVVISKEVNALTTDLLHDILDETQEKYWKDYTYWRRHERLFDKDYDKFVKYEKESGSAFWDDPPEGWTEREMAIYSKGYAHGRSVETGNIQGVIRSLAWMAKELLNTDYGFRDGLPSIQQIDNHYQKTLLGFWQLMIKNEDGNSFVHQFPVLYCLRVEDDKIQHFDDKWKEFTEENKKRIITSMPTTTEGIPVSWESITPKTPKKEKKK